MILHKDALQFEENGVVRIENFFDRNDIELLKHEYLQMIAHRNTADIYRDEPLVVLWTHVIGANKATCRLSELPAAKTLIINKIAPFVGHFLNSCINYSPVSFLQLLEVIVFNKPPLKSNTLNWHQDVAYFPIKPNNQVAIWFPLSDISPEIGPMVYAHCSHRLGIRGSVNLHTRQVFDGEERPLIPDNPEDIGLKVVEYPIPQTDMLIHDGYTWHKSKPNISANTPRMGVSVRFLIEEGYFDPRPGQGATFTKQIDLQPGDKIDSVCFPIIWKTPR